MKTKLFFLIFSSLFLYKINVGQFNDVFDDGDFLNNPTWFGDTSSFVITNNLELQMNAPDSLSEAFLVTDSKAIKQGIWEFYIRLAFNPSSANYSRVYCVSNRKDSAELIKGYYIQVGGQSGNLDDIRFYKQNGMQQTLLIDGYDGLVAISPQLKIRLRRFNNGNWELYADTNLSGNFISQGSCFDNEFDKSSYVGIYNKYTATRKDKFFFDDFNVSGTFYPDTIAPEIVSHVVLTSNVIELTFSEPIQSSSIVLQNFSINGSSISQVISLSNVKVRLVLAAQLTSGVTYKIDYQNIEDLNGNVANKQYSFFHYEPGFPIHRDIQINEVLPDPFPDENLPISEFIELYNFSEKYFVLDSFSIQDASGKKERLSGIIKPKEYLILISESDTALWKGFSNVSPVSGLPSLNNTEDDLTLFYKDSVEVDRCFYKNSWYKDPIKKQGGWSLEQINPTQKCSGENNWIESIHVNGGTPGKENSQYDDERDISVPKVIDWLLTDSTILVSFNEQIDSTHFTLQLVNTQLLVFDWKISDNKLELRHNSTLAADEVYTLELYGIEDCQSNAIDTTLKVAIGKQPVFGDVILTEIMANPLPGQSILNTEYIELFNNSIHPIQLGGLIIKDLTKQVELLPAVLFSGEYLTYQNIISLNNTSDLIVIKRDSLTLDSIYYNDNWYGDEEKKSGGFSLERIDLNAFCFGAENWDVTQSEEGGTPGYENTVIGRLEGADELNLLHYQFLSDSSISIVFSQDISHGFYEAFIDGTAASHIRKGASNQLIIEYQKQFIRGITVALTLNEVHNCTQAVSNSFNVLCYYPLPHDISINEVLFNPNKGGSDFIEISNSSKYEIELGNWSFVSINTKGDSTFYPLSNLNLKLLPDQIIAFAESISNTKLFYDQACYACLKEINLPSLPDKEGKVILLDNQRKIMDRFDYEERFHHVLLKDVEGVSLEKKAPALKSAEMNNWHSAASSVGYATPGIQNSQFSENLQTNEVIELTHELFSPDNDGVKDVLEIKYNLEKEGYTLNASVYSKEGIKVRDITGLTLPSRSGVYFWDGTSDDGEKCMNGVYIIHCQLIHPEGRVINKKLTSVLVSKN